MLSKTCKYALRAIIYIGKNSVKGEKIRIKKITDEIDVPAHFLAKILQNLAKEKVLASTKGPSGGFYIDRPLTEISLLEVIEVIEGKEFFVNCLLKNEPCDCQGTEEKHCPLHATFGPVKTELVRFYKETTLHDIISGIAQHESLIAL